jgi:hypothetical protein
MRAYLFALSLAATAAVAPTLAAAQPRPAAPPPAAEPPAEAAAPPTAAPARAAADVDALRQEYLALRDRLFRSRARAAAVASALYSSKLRIALGYDSGRHQTVTRATIRLDGASVYDDGDGAIAGAAAPRFDGHVAPGRHLVTIRIEATARDDERFTTATESTFVVQVPQGKDVVVTARASDEGDLGHAWSKGEKGSYRLRLDVAIKSEARPTAPRAGAARRSDGGRAAR